jgi:hypothetical protein
MINYFLYYKLIKDLEVSKGIKGPTVTVFETLSQNEMTQFYLKCAGVAVLGVIGVCVIKAVIPASFSVKVLSPWFFQQIQNFTPFFQEQRTFTLHQDGFDFDWMVNIVNEKTLEILIKTSSSPDFVSASNYVLKLQSEATDTGGLSMSPDLVNTVLPLAQETSAIIDKISVLF